MWFAPAVALNLHRLLIFDPPTHSFSSFNNLSPFSEKLFCELTAKMLHDCEDYLKSACFWMPIFYVALCFRILRLEVILILTPLEHTLRDGMRKMLSK